MSRDSGSEQPDQRDSPGQRTVAELIAQYGGDASGGGRRRRRRAEEPSTTAPQEIIERVISETDPSRKLPPGAVPSDPVPSGPMPPDAVSSGAMPSMPPGSAPSGGETSGPVPLGAVPPRQPDAAPTPPGRGGPPPPAPADTPAERSGRGVRDQWSLRFSTAESSGAAPVPTAMPTGDSLPFRNRESTVQRPVRPNPQPPRRPTGPGTPRAPEPPAPGIAVNRQRTEHEPVTEEFQPVDAQRVFYAAMPTTVIPSAGNVEDEPGDPEYAADYPAGSGYSADPEYQEDLDFADSDVEEPERAAVSARIEAEAPEAEAGAKRESAPRQWLLLVLQVIAGLLGGGGLWLGFRLLWLSIPVAAIVAALLVTGCLIFIARRSASTRDLQTVVLAALVGLVCTVSPVAVVLVGQ